MTLSIKMKLLFAGKKIMQEVCEEFICTRLTPVLYKKTIDYSNGTTLGTFEVFEFEEVVDSVVHFLTEKTIELDYITLKINSSRIFVAYLE